MKVSITLPGFPVKQNVRTTRSGLTTSENSPWKPRSPPFAADSGSSDWALASAAKSPPACTFASASSASARATATDALAYSPAAWSAVQPKRLRAAA